MHTIRLRAAWRSTGTEHTRRFNKPTGLEGGDRVWVALDGVAPADPRNGVMLNGAPLAIADGRCDITALLEPANTLVVRTDDPAVLLAVRLEIEPA